MKKKLRSKHGSTLIEVLCAFLLIAMSISLFAVAVGAANHINVTTDRYWTSFFEELKVLESRSDKKGTGKMQITTASDDVPAEDDEDEEDEDEEDEEDAVLAEVDIQLYKGSAGDGLLYYVPK